MKYINSGRVLIISDVHQNLAYVKACLDLEIYDHVIFLGDWLDTFFEIDNETFFSVNKTCEEINYYFHELGEKAIWLCGNHDIAYLASYMPYSHKVKPAGEYCCSGWTKTKAKEFNKYINPDWVNNLELCVRVGDYICSHAGFHFDHFKPYQSELDNIVNLWHKWEKDKFTFFNEYNHWIWQVGRLRWSNSPHQVGSPVWLDWGEFTGIDNFKQIVGH